MSVSLLTSEQFQALPNQALWQSLVWARYQESLGRQTRLYGAKNGENSLSGGALVVIDTTALGLSTWDIPRGPVGQSPEVISELLEHIKREAKKERCLALTFSPVEEVSLGRPSPRHEQPEATLLLDLTLSDGEILAQMKQKGRYNIRLAEKSGVTVSQSGDIDAFYSLMKKTGDRDQFGILPKVQYEKFLSALPGSFLLLAKKDGEAIAGLLGVIHGNQGIYYYGASSYAHRALMAPYLLQWNAIQYCKQKGCTSYDFLGIAPEEGSDHTWSGITRFKKQFGGEVKRYPVERQIILRPVSHALLSIKRALLG